MMAALRRWWRQRRAHEPVEARVQRAVDEEQAVADAMGVDRRISQNEARLGHLRAQVEVYRRGSSGDHAPSRGR